MSERRPANLLALAVFACLYERPMHPYEMAATLRERRKEASIKLNYGSLYTVIESLAKAGLIVPRQTTREGNRPERTVYELTTVGETMLLEWMAELLAQPAKEYPRFEAALSLLPVLPAKQAVIALQQRLHRLREIIAQLAQEARAVKQIKLPRLFSIEGEYHATLVKAEIRFVEGLLRDLAADKDSLFSDWTRIRKQLLKDKGEK